MFAVVRTGGKQYRVTPGDKIVVEKLAGDAGDRITLDDVLLAGDGSNLKSVDGLKVAAEIVAQAKGDKVTVFKKRRRHNYRRKKGHRQQLTILRIVAIGDQKEERKPKAEAAKTGDKPAAKTEAKKADAAPAKKDAEKKPVAKAPASEKKPAETKAAKPSTKSAAPAKAAAKKSSKKK